MNKIQLVIRHILTFFWPYYQKKIKINGANYKSHFEHSIIGNSIIGIDGSIYEVNQAFCKIMGYKKEELEAKNILELTHPDDIATTLDFNQSLVNEKISNAHYEQRFIHKNENILWIDVSTCLGINKASNQKLFYTTIVDITERKQDKENELQIIFDSIPAWIFYKDTQNKFLKVNKALANVIGIPKEKLEGESLNNLFSKELANSYWEDDKHVIKTGIAKEKITERMTTPNGHFWVQTNKIPYKDSHGNILGIIGFTLDITEQKRLEEQTQKIKENLERFFELIPDMVCTISPTGYFTMLNQIWESILGYTLEDLYSLSYTEFIHPDDKEITIKETQKQLDEMGVVQLTIRFRCIDGTFKTFEWIATPAIDGMIYAAARDITERKKAEEELISLNAQLKESNATKDKMFSIIGHDLRSPFTAIIGFSELLLKNVHKQEVQKAELFAENVIFTAKETLSLLNNLLSWAKSQTGRVNFNPNNIDLYFVVFETIHVSGTMAKLKNITINNSILENTLTYADRDMLETIVRNLLSNSLKFTPKDGQIDIAAISNNNMIEVIIADNGVGMSEEIRCKLFITDSNITTRGTDNEKGSGLGLILCKEFVERQGGTIWVESEIGKGSKFHFTLPMLKE